jgi:hypothetical protein
MATTPIKLKRSHTISVIPDTSDLIAGEVALNTVDKKFYVRDGSSQVITLANHYATDFDVNVVTFKVTVATSSSAHSYHGTGSSNKYKINGVFSPYLKLIPRITYRFDQSDSSNSGHPLLFYYDSGKTTAYTTGVTVVNGSSGPGSSGAYTQIIISDTTPQVLHYQCSSHANMGWALTTSTRNLTGFDTDDLSEGSTNLYFTNARADARISNAIKDEDNMASNSATHVPSQQSVKAYVDATVEATNELVEDSSPQLGANLDLNSNNITGTGNISTTGNLTLTSTDAGASAAPTIDLVRDSSSPADADYLGQLAFKGDDDGGSSHTYAKITGKIGDASAGSEDGLLEFAVVSGGSNEIVARIKTDGILLNTGNTLRFEGATADAHETTLTVTDPTADRTITLPNASGTVLLADGDGSSLTGISSDLSNDSSPQLGGDLDVVTHGIVSTSNRNIAITPNGSGKVIIDGLSHPVADGNAGQVLKTDGSGNLAFASVGSLAGAGIQNLSDDSSPQLGGNLDVVTHSIVSASNRDINIIPNGNGKVVVGTNGIEFGDGSIQTAAGATTGFSIAMATALG